MHNMVTAAIDKDEQRVCAFHFMLVTTLIHELGGHGVVAFLGNGSYDIPFSRITTPHVHPKDAGLRLQELLFGGTVHFYRGSGQGADDGQVGSPDRIPFEPITNVRIQAGIPYLMKQVRGRYVVERIESRVIVDMYHGRKYTCSHTEPNANVSLIARIQFPNQNVWAVCRPKNHAAYGFQLH